MRAKNSKLLFLVVSLLILVIVLGFSSSLYISFFQSNYLKSVVASNSVAGGEVVRKIEYAMKYGKPLTNFYGIEKMLAEIKQGSALIGNVRIISPDGIVLYGINDVDEGEHIGAKLTRSADFNAVKEGEKYRIVEELGKYEVFMPITDQQGWVGNLNITFDEASITAQTSEYLDQTVETNTIIALIAAGCLVLLIYAVPLVRVNGELRIKRLMAVVLVVLGLAQVISGLYNISLFKSFYHEVARQNTAVAAILIQKNIEGLRSKGINYHELYHIEDWFKHIIESVPEIASIQIQSSSRGVLYGSSNQANHSTVAGETQYTFQLVTDATGQDFSLEVVLSPHYVEKQIKKIALDALIVLIVALLSMVELTMFLVQVLQYKVTNNAPPKQGISFLFIRPLTYAFFVSWAMSFSFIPLMMLDLYRPLLGLSQGVVLGLPVSVEAFTTIFSTVVTGYLIDRRGWKPLFIYGVLIFAIGTLLSGLAGTEEIFILSRAITGIGYGFSWMSLRGFAAMAPTEEGKTAAFAGLNAGIYAGINCGVVLGAMLAERIGFSKVFLLSAALVFAAGILTYWFAGNVIIAVSTEHQKGRQAIKDTWINLKAAGRDPEIRMFFLLIAIPSAISLMFLDYCIPIIAKTAHVDSADMGWAFLLYGLCVVYLGPFFAKFIGTRISMEKAMLLSQLISIAALFIFSVVGSYAAAMLAVILLGIASSFGFVARNNYLLSLDSVKTLGAGAGLSVYGVVNKLGQAAGPLIFGAFAAFGMAGGTGLVSSFLFILLGMFIVITRKRNYKTAKKQV